MSTAKKIGLAIALAAFGYGAYHLITSSSGKPAAVNNGNPTPNLLPAQNSGTKTNNLPAANTLVTQPANIPANVPATTVAPQSTTVATTVANTTQLPVLDQNLVLKFDMIGNEVRELQSRLNVWGNGVFNLETQSTLFERKGVNQISLNQYDSMPDRVAPVVVAPVSTHLYKIGDTLITTRSTTVKEYRSATSWKGTSQNIGSGKTLGVVVALYGSLNSAEYIVKISGFNIPGMFESNPTTHYRVKQSDVRKK